MAPDLTPRQHATGSGIAGVTIRRVSSLAEYDECVRMQHETWGEQFTESVSATVLRITQEMGGVTAAAFRADGYMLGFVFGITGVRSGELAHWSDMLAVRPAARDMGLGARLKHYQRDLVREIGVRTMYWTYDPLVARNAHLNLERLGARAVEYRPAFYGENTGSVMHAGLGTDRFIVRWDVTCSIEELVAALPARSNAPIVNRASAAATSPTCRKCASPFRATSSRCSSTCRTSRTAGARQRAARSSRTLGVATTSWPSSATTPKPAAPTCCALSDHSTARQEPRPTTVH